MIKLFEKTSLKKFILLVSFCCTIAVCFLLFYFVRSVDKSYSNLLKEEIAARTLIQSIFTKRLDNYANVLKIEKANSLDTVEKYLNNWDNLSAEIGNDFIKLQEVVPKDSLKLAENLQEIIKKRNVMLQNIKENLLTEKNGISINLMSNINSSVLKNYNESINIFLNNYNNYLVNRSNALTQRTLRKSNIYLAILPIPMILIFLFFGHILILFLRDFALDEQ